MDAHWVVSAVYSITGGLLRPDRRELPWRGAFVVGLMLGQVLCVAASGAPLALEVSGDIVALIAGGLLVGLWHLPGQWLHQRRWGLLLGSAAGPFNGGNSGIRGDGGSGGVLEAARGRDAMKDIKAVFVALVGGHVFGLGLAVAQMANPA